MFTFLLVMALFVVALIAAAFIESNDLEHKGLLIWPAVLFPTIVLVLSLSLTYHTRELADLRNQLDVSIPNHVAYLKSLPKNVLVPSPKNVVVDAANLQQSKSNTDAWNEYRHEVNSYNEDLVKFQFAKSHPVMAFFLGGLYPDLPSDMVPLTIQ